jgi:hypothetical protein
MPTRLGEFTTVSTSNFYFYPPPGSSSTPQGYLLATGPNGFMVPQNPNVLTSTIIGLGFLDSSISTALSATTACLAQTSTLNTYVSINTASISSQGQQISTISTNLQGLSNFVVVNIGATPYLSTQVSDLTAGYSSLVYGFSSLSTFVGGQATKLQSVSDSLSANILNVSSLSTTVSSLVVANSSLSFNFSSLSSVVSSYAAFTCTISDSLSANIRNVSSLSSFVSAQATLLSSTATSLCTTVEILSSVSSVVAGLAAGTVTVGDFTNLSTYTSSLGASVGFLEFDVSTLKLQVSSLSTNVSSLNASVGFLTLDVSTLKLNVSTLSTNVSSLQSTTTYLLNNSLTNTGVLSLLSSQNNVFFGSNIQVSSVASNLYFNAGRVGIGCNTPTSNFVVAGTSLFTGASLISSSLTTSSNLRVNRNVSTLLNADTSIFTVIIGNSPGTTTNILNVQGGGYFLGGLDINGNSFFRSTVDVTSGNFIVNRSTLFVSSGVGRVGIGCNTPAYTLDVAGTTHTSSLIVDTAISTNYIVQRTPLIWSYGVSGTINSDGFGYTNIVGYNRSNYEPPNYTTPLSNLAGGQVFNIPYSGIYNIKLSYQSFNSNTGNSFSFFNEALMCSSNLSGGPSNILNFTRTSDANNIGTQIPVSMEFTSTFTTNNSIFIHLALGAGLNLANNFNFTVQYFG